MCISAEAQSRSRIHDNLDSRPNSAATAAVGPTRPSQKISQKRLAVAAAAQHEDGLSQPQQQQATIATTAAALIGADGEFEGEVEAKVQVKGWR